ncbi:hypothetical protein NHQ30_002354 [Ciborinia camelliae]|nr:hypothetical protein NHQ30_002354 [Ciborinia camelliae]
MYPQLQLQMQQTLQAHNLQIQANDQQIQKMQHDHSLQLQQVLALQVGGIGQPAPALPPPPSPQPARQDHGVTQDQRRVHTKGKSEQQLRERRCGNCGRSGHVLKKCMGPVTEYGHIDECPLCNTKQHTFVQCTNRESKFDVRTFRHYFLQCRNNAPPLRFPRDFRKEEFWRLEVESAKEEDTSPCRLWSVEFSRQFQQDNPYYWEKKSIYERVIVDPTWSDGSKMDSFQGDLTDRQVSRARSRSRDLRVKRRNDRSDRLGVNSSSFDLILSSRSMRERDMGDATSSRLTTRFEDTPRVDFDEFNIPVKDELSTRYGNMLKTEEVKEQVKIKERDI